MANEFTSARKEHAIKSVLQLRQSRTSGHIYINGTPLEEREYCGKRNFIITYTSKRRHLDAIPRYDITTVSVYKGSARS